MNLQHAKIAELCKGLKLERVAADWSALAQGAVAKQSSFADFLERLLAAERKARARSARARHYSSWRRCRR